MIASDLISPKRESSACYAACGPRPTGQFEFWCGLDANSPTSNVKVRKK